MRASYEQADRALAKLIVRKVLAVAKVVELASSHGHDELDYMVFLNYIQKKTR